LNSCSVNAGGAWRSFFANESSLVGLGWELKCNSGFRGLSSGFSSTGSCDGISADDDARDDKIGAGLPAIGIEE
jgi:hypothetical protein